MLNATLVILMLLLLSITIYLAFESITEKHSEEDPILRDVKATLEPFLLQNNIDVLSKIKLMIEKITLKQPI